VWPGENLTTFGKTLFPPTSGSQETCFDISVNFYQTSAPYRIIYSHFCEDVTSHTEMTKFLKKLSTFFKPKSVLPTQNVAVTPTTDPATTNLHFDTIPRKLANRVRARGWMLPNSTWHSVTRRKFVTMSANVTLISFDRRGGRLQVSPCEICDGKSGNTNA